MTERTLLARNIHEGMQVKDLDSGEWLTVKTMLHVTRPGKFVVLTYTDGTESVIAPTGRVLCRRHAEDGA